MSRNTDNQPAAPGRFAAATHHPRGTVRGDVLALAYGETLRRLVEGGMA